MKFKESTRKPRKSCYIINEKAQIGQYHQGFVYYLAQNPETGEIQMYVRHLALWCEKWVDLAECVDKTAMKEMGMKTTGKTTWKKLKKGGELK